MGETRLTKNGISTTTQRDCFRSEGFDSALFGGFRVQWDYRDTAGILHSGIAKSHEAAEQAAAKFGYRKEATHA